MLKQKSDGMHIFLLALLILLVEGFCGISIQMLTLRQLMPFVGNSVVVTSIVIGIFLLFLALGYQWGSRCSENYLATLSRNFIIAGVLVGIGLSHTFLSAFFPCLIINAHLHTLTALTIYSLMITAPCVFLLGQTLPITSNLFQLKTTIGAVSGHVLFISTIGSFLGSVATTLILFKYLGVSLTVIINYVLLITLAIMLINITCSKAMKIVLPIILLASINPINQLNTPRKNSSIVADNAYADYQVLKAENKKQEKVSVFSINGNASSILSKEGKAAGYIQEIRRILFKNFDIQNKEILMIGAGGFTFTAGGRNKNHITYIDIDPDIKK